MMGTRKPRDSARFCRWTTSGSRRRLWSACQCLRRCRNRHGVPQAAYARRRVPEPAEEPRSLRVEPVPGETVKPCRIPTQAPPAGPAPNYW